MQSDDSAPVCAEPKIFVGQVPPLTTEDSILQVFSTYGPVEQISFTKRDEKKRGFAMLRFGKWAHAEAAIEGENGKLTLGGDRHLVVKFADPPKMSKDGLPGLGITPKKLFVGQISTATESEIRDLFTPYGKLVHVNIHVSPKGGSCAFVKFDKWCEAEAAVEAINGKVTLGSSLAPLVVKFADGKAKKEPFVAAVGTKRGNDEGLWPGNKRVNMGVAGSMDNAAFNAGVNGPYGMGVDQYGMMSNNLNQQMGLHDGGMHGGMNGGMRSSANMNHMPGLGGHGNMMMDGSVGGRMMGGMGGMMNAGMNMKYEMGGPGMGSMGNMHAGMGMLDGGANSAMGMGGGMMGMGGMGGMGQMQQSGGMMGGMNGMMNPAQMPGSALQQAPGMMGGVPGGMGGMMNSGMANGMANGGGAMGAMPPMGSGGQMGMMGAMGGAARMGAMSSLGNGGAMGNMGGMGAGMGPGMAQMGSMGAMNVGGYRGQHVGMPRGVVGLSSSPQGPLPPRTPGGAEFGGGSGGGVANGPCPWKLFVGQVPFEATEQHLLPLFSQFGDVKMVHILRKPGSNQSRGCAFITYANQAQAIEAIKNVNGKLCVPGDLRAKPLIVNLATVKGESGH